MSYPLSKARRKQKITNSPYSSPRRPRNKGQTATVIYEGNTVLRDSLQAKLDALLNPPAPAASSDPNNAEQWMDVDENENENDAPLPETLDNPLPDVPVQPAQPQESTANKGSPPKRHILPNAADYRLYNEWMAIIPTLVEDYIQYTNNMIGHAVGIGPDQISRQGCICGDRKLKITSLTCLYAHRE